MKETIAKGIYRHYKGKDYRVIDVVRHSETLEELVLYETLYPNDLSRFWVRPLHNFTSAVEVKGEVRPRFAFVAPSEDRLNNHSLDKFEK